MKRTAILFTFLSGLLLSQAAATAEELSYADLVQRLYDLERLATPPVQGEKCGSWTSADRAARYNEQTVRYENWAANKDGTGFIRREGSGIVAAEMKGPGVIWRVSSARAEKGHIKIYIDGTNEPVLDIPFEDYFDNRKAPFNYPELVHVKAKGKNNFIPVPYLKSCKVHVWNPQWIKHGYEGAKPDDYWWGEGDEKFFVDGEKFPSTFGTGSEDYFGFAWATPDRYDSAFQNQILNEKNSNGHISMSRFQIADNVPFQTSFEAVIEKYYPNQWNGNYTLYDTIVYWYQEANTEDTYKAVPVAERMGYYAMPADLTSNTGTHLR